MPHAHFCPLVPNPALSTSIGPGFPSQGHHSNFWTQWQCHVGDVDWILRHVIVMKVYSASQPTPFLCPNEPLWASGSMTLLRCFSFLLSRMMRGRWGTMFYQVKAMIFLCKHLWRGIYMFIFVFGSIRHFIPMLQQKNITTSDLHEFTNSFLYE